MSPSAYIIALPLGLIAISTWLVKMEADSFRTPLHLDGIQTQPQSVYMQKMKEPVPAPIQQFSHDRYGWIENPEDGQNSLGNNRSHRTLGARTSQGNADWLELQVEAKKITGKVLPPIPGFLENAPMAEAPFSTVPADSGFHITADEATKLDVKTQKVIFTGHVSLTSPQFDLTASNLVVLLSSDKKTFKLAEATGDVNVQIKSGPPDKRYRGQSEKAVYQPAEGFITMTGWPKIQGQGQELIAAAPDTKVLLYTATGKLVTSGRTQTRVARQLIADDSAKRDATSSGQ